MQVAFYFAGEITQVLDANPWVRCASGNVSVEDLFNGIQSYCTGIAVTYHVLVSLSSPVLHMAEDSITTIVSYT